MELSVPIIVLLLALFFFVAFLYASVGHGGASGYLGVLSMFMFSPKEMATTALLLNIFVAGIAFVAYHRQGYFSARLILPFLFSSIPFAFLGGVLTTSPAVYTILLSVALLAASLRLLIRPAAAGVSNVVAAPPYALALPIGGAIGLLSGIVGVGGGIFLSPVILFLRWSDPKHTAAAAACFIVVNSLAGIIGRQLVGSISVGDFLPLLAAAGIGGIMGARYGSRKFSGIALQRLLGVVLLIAAGKLLFTSFR